MSTAQVQNVLLAEEELLDRDQQAREQRQTRNRLKEIVALKQRCSSREGRYGVRLDLIRSGVFESSFNLNNAQMAKNEGRREVGVELLSDLRTHCWPELIELEREWMEDEQ